MKLGLIGCGKMGRALLEGALKAGIVKAEDVYVSSRTAETRQALSDELGVNAVESNVEVVQNSNAVYLCTKPHIIPLVLVELNEEPECLNDVLLISAAAGLTLETLESPLPHGTRMVRCMPNTPSLIGKGAAAYTLGTHANDADAETTCKLLGAAGSVIEVPEKLMDAVTGVSGSGPAYVYTFIEALADGGVFEGLPRQQALELATQTVLGAASMVAETGLHPAILRDMVCSPGGTTITAVKALEDNGFRSAAINAVSASANKARELGRK
ncbi:pyrroline-5-carboxylate reductase [Rubritalea squalenifaciens DSM 18772]|uniref:Pyrroline-5-carboxylate reductase n=1 Tax=Rubritalea squalenifaciens DSM 18772 TaxID=1123071 RepID=A0A1M6PB16_9BACT|nr:pyrroline-5-carboxylate reductase [Rubritalea squalenifaciens]SHK05161.1 pyrroline-5-carboxylate reductase [Rubritalea squalenifaciens DSM 18772]